MATIYVDNEAHAADPRQNLLHACLSLGYDLPYFCWHPALGSVGACRQCAVKQYKNADDTAGKLVMACMTPAADGARISIQDPEAAAFRAGVIEGMMTNHPHDCPVCDEGGECHLQDMTVMTGHRTRVYRFGKRTFRNQYLGPLINHEMNRCIQCYRCVRYYREYAGGHDLNAFRLRDTVFFGRHADGVFENEFSGNLVEVCPTGVFTDATLKRHYTRKWDLQMAPSVCPHCALGCNTTVGERYGMLRRVVNRYNGHVNGYFLCDRGRFGYEYVNSDQRIREPLVDGAPATRDEALDRAADLLKKEHVIGIGSPRATLEANFLLRELVGPANFYSGLSLAGEPLAATALRLLRSGPARTPSLEDVEHADAALVLGEDLTNTAPIMALRLRQSVRQAPMKIADAARIPRWLDHAVREVVQDQKGPLFIAAPYATRLDDVAAATLQATPERIARLGFAVAHAIDSAAPAVEGADEELLTLAAAIATALRNAERPVIVSGVACQSAAVLEAAAQVAWALCKLGRPAGLAFALPEVNSFGAALFEAQPLSAILQTAADGSIDTAVILENDLFRRAPAPLVEAFFRSVRHVIVLDSVATPTSARAELTLPAAAIAESDGTLVNAEGRAQRCIKAFPPKGEIRESWHWLRDVAETCEKTAIAEWRILDDVIAAIAEQLPAFARIPAAAPSRAHSGKIPREPHRYSGRTSMLANISVHEPKPPQDPDSALAFSMESGPAPPVPSLTPFFWAPGWNSIQSTNKFQAEIGGALRGGDPGVRLVEPAADAAPKYVTPPAAPRSEPGAWRIIPCFHIFGSDELSRLAPGIAELSPQPYVALNPADAQAAGIAAGDAVDVAIGESTVTLNVVLRPDLAPGLAAIPVGAASVEGLIHFPAGTRATIHAAVSTGGAS